MYQVMQIRPRREQHRKGDFMRKADSYRIRSAEVYQIRPSNLQAYALQPGTSKSGESRAFTSGQSSYMRAAVCRILCDLSARHAIGDSPEWAYAMLAVIEATVDELYSTDDMTMLGRWRAECRTDGAEDTVQFEAMEATVRMQTGHARPDDRQVVVTYERKLQAAVRASRDLLVGLARLLKSPREAR